MSKVMSVAAPFSPAAPLVLDMYATSPSLISVHGASASCLHIFLDSQAAVSIPGKRKMFRMLRDNQKFFCARFSGVGMQAELQACVSGTLTKGPLRRDRTLHESQYTMMIV